MNKLKVPRFAAIAIGGVVSIVLLVTVFLVTQNLSIRAGDEAPRDVVVSDITSTSAKINWTTSAKTQGVVEYGTSPTTLNLVLPEAESTTDHEVELTLLQSGTSYYLQISIGGKKFDNAGVPWTFSTKGEGDDNPSLTPTSSTRPTPISTVVIPNPNESSCDEKICERIKLKIGQGCITQDYIKCLKNESPTFAPLTTP